ncbi:MAG: Prolyl tripeptidyl peptidase precursor, partial [Pseudomonadota bacterium]
DRRTKAVKQIVVPGKRALAFDPGYRVRAEVIPARDNTPLVTYLATPPGRLCAVNDCPLVVLPHGGPFARDEYPSNATTAWLTNRGYAVLTVNFRGSRGFGKAFKNLARGQWGLATQNDISDAVDWAVKKAKVADPKRIAIVGASFGGDAAINGITFEPDRYACAVALGAGANLASFVEKVVATSPELADHLYENVGDVRKPEVKAALQARSAFANIAAVKKPILIAHGAQDMSAPFDDMVAYAEALRARGAKVAFVVYPDEGHGFNNPQTKVTHYGLIENFLAGCLGGRPESVDVSTARQKIDIRFGEQDFTFLKNSRVGNE